MDTVLNNNLCGKNLKRTIENVLESWSGYEVIRELMHLFPKVDIYLAGGVLRDIILQNHRITKDVDLFIKGESIQEFMGELQNNGALIRGPFGSPRWKPANNNEIYADVIPVNYFHNGLWKCEDIVDVLNQFDFTGNAIAVDLTGWLFFNPQNGVRDLERNIMRAIRFDYPNQRFVEGYEITRSAVVWFRILHYANVLNLNIEPVTLAWLHQHQEYTKYTEEFEQLFFTLEQDALEVVD